MMNRLKAPGVVYVLAFLVASGIAALTYHFNMTLANFLIGAGLIALAYGIALQVIDAVRHHQNGSVAE